MVVSLVVGSLTLTRSRHPPAAAACASSEVLMSGRDRVAAAGRPFPVCPAHRLRQYRVPRGVRTTAPAPQMSCLVTRNGMQDISKPAEPAARLTR